MVLKKIYMCIWLYSVEKKIAEYFRTFIIVLKYILYRRQTLWMYG